MQATPSFPQPDNRLNRNLSYLLMAPITAFVLGVLITAVLVTSYQSRHNDRIFTGVMVNQVDLSQLTMAEAAEALAAGETAVLTLVDPATGQTWTYTAEELGLRIDQQATLEAAYAVGRQGGPGRQLNGMVQSWYHGLSVPPVYVLDEGQLDTAINALSGQINRPALNANMVLGGPSVSYDAGQTGRLLDTADLRNRLTLALTQMQDAQVELLIQEIKPTIVDTAEVSQEIERMTATPIRFYLQEPLDDVDLMDVTLSEAELSQWLRVTVTEGENGRYQHDVFVDENALRQWLQPYANQVARDPVNARFYFDDNTRELVLVAPHVNGRELDIDATLAKLQEQLRTPNRSIPFIIKPIVPEVHSGATATELGITELITETTTWFFGSSDERKHNIARSAANFFGIVIAPGEEFSFNKYLGSISEADGYEQGFIIIGGQTVEGIGGGVCQVSTTLYQTAFNAGFPITERWEHGYMLGYYNDGEGPGMDATVYSPIVDMKFINNTPHHLLIENYYNTEFEALTFKFYSTSLGRQVVKERFPWQNIVPPPEEDRWEFNENMEPGTVEQVDWATEGADVTVRRLVYNANGVLIGDEYFVSNYIPVPNVFQYGPGVEPFDYSLVPDD